MSPFILEEGWFLLYSVLLGIGITFVYDCLRIWRRVFAHGMFWISLEDLFYWIFVSGCIFYLLYRENNGAFRWFAIMGAAIGMLLFKKTLSPLWVRFGSLLFGRLRQLAGRVRRLILWPVRAAGAAVGKRAGAFGRKMRQSARILKKRLTVGVKMTKITLCRHDRGRRRGKGNDKA